MLKSGSKRISEKENVNDSNTVKKSKGLSSSLKRTPAPRTPLTTRTPLKGWAMNTTPVPPRTVQKRTLADELAEVGEVSCMETPTAKEFSKANATPLRPISENSELEDVTKAKTTSLGSIAESLDFEEFSKVDATCLQSIPENPNFEMLNPFCGDDEEAQKLKEQQDNLLQEEKMKAEMLLQEAYAKTEEYKKKLEEEEGKDKDIKKLIEEEKFKNEEMKKMLEQKEEETKQFLEQQQKNEEVKLMLEKEVQESKSLLEKNEQLLHEEKIKTDEMKKMWEEEQMKAEEIKKKWEEEKDKGEEEKHRMREEYELKTSELQQCVDGLKTQMVAQEEKINQLTHENHALKSRCSQEGEVGSPELEARVAALQALADNLNATIRKHLDEKADFEKQLANNNDKLADIEIKCQHLQAELEEEKNKHVAIMQTYEAAKDEMNKLEVALSASEAKVEKLTQQLEENVAALEARVAELTGATARADKLTEDNVFLLQKLESTEAAHATELQEKAAQIKQLEEKMSEAQTQHAEELKMAEQRHKNERDAFDEPATPAKRLDRRMSFAPSSRLSLMPHMTPLPTPRPLVRDNAATKETQEANKRVHEVQTAQIKSLQKEIEGLKKKIAEHESIRQTFTNKEIELARIESQDSQNKEHLKNAKLEIKKLMTEKETARKALTDLEKELEKAKIECKHEKDRAKQQSKDAGEAELLKEALQKELKLIQKKLEGVQKDNESLKGIDAKRRELTLSLAQAERKLSDSQATTQKCQKDLTDAQTKLNKMTEDFNKLQGDSEKSVADMNKENKQLEVRIQTASAEIIELNNKILNATALAKKEKEEYESKLLAATEKHAKTSQKHKDAKAEIERAREENTSFKLKCQQLENDCKRELSERERLAESLKETQLQLGTTNNMLSEAKAEINLLKAQCATQQQQHENIISELRARLSECNREYQQLQSDLTNAKNVVEQVRQEYDTELKTSEKEYLLLQKEHEATNAELLDTRKQLELAAHTNDELNDKYLALDNQLRSEIDKTCQLSKEMTRLMKEAESNHAEIKKMQSVSSEQAQSLTMLTNQLQAKEKEREAKGLELAELVSAKNEVEKQLAVTAQALSTTEQKCQELRGNIDTISGHLRSVTAQYKEQLSMTEAKTAAIAELQAKGEQLKREAESHMTKLANQIQVLNQEGCAKDSTISELTMCKSQLTDELTVTTQAFEESEQKCGELRAALEATKAQLQSAQETYNALCIQHKQQISMTEAKAEKIAELEASAQKAKEKWSLAKTALEADLASKQQVCEELDQKCAELQAALEATTVQLKSVHEAHNALSIQHKQQISVTEAKVSEIADLEAKAQQSNEQWSLAKTALEANLTAKQQAFDELNRKCAELRAALEATTVQLKSAQEAHRVLSIQCKQQISVTEAKVAQIAEMEARTQQAKEEWVLAKTVLETDLSAKQQALVLEKQTTLELRVSLETSEAHLRDSQEAHRITTAQLKQQNVMTETKAARIAELEARAQKSEENWAAAHAASEKELAALQERIVDLQGEVKASETQLRNAQDAHRALSAQFRQQTAVTDAKNARIAEMEARFLKAEEDWNDAKAAMELARAQELQQALNAMKAEHERAQFKLLHQLQVKTDEMASKDTKINDLTIAHNHLEEELTVTTQAFNEMEQKCAELQPIAAQVKSLQEANKNMTVQLKQLVTTKASLESELAASRQALAATADQLKSLQESHSEKCAQYQEQLAQCNSKSTQLAELNSKKMNLETELTSTRQRLNESQSALTNLQALYGDQEQTNFNLNHQLQVKSEALAAKEHKLAELTEVNTQLSEELTVTTQAFEEEENKTTDLKKSLEAARAESKKYHEQLKTLGTQVKQQQAAIEQKSAQLLDLSSKLTNGAGEWASSRAQFEDEIASLRKSLSDAEQKHSAAQSALSGSKVQVRNLQESLRALNEKSAHQTALIEATTAEMRDAEKSFAAARQDWEAKERTLQAKQMAAEKTIIERDRDIQDCTASLERVTADRERDIRDYKANIEKVSKEREINRKKLNETMTELESAKQYLSATRKQLLSAEEAREADRTQIAGLTATVEELKVNIAKIENERTSLEASLSKVTKTCSQLKKEKEQLEARGQKYLATVNEFPKQRDELDRKRQEAEDKFMDMQRRAGELEEKYVKASEAWTQERSKLATKYEALERHSDALDKSLNREKARKKAAAAEHKEAIVAMRGEMEQSKKEIERLTDLVRMSTRSRANTGEDASNEPSSARKPITRPRLRRHASEAAKLETP